MKIHFNEGFNQHPKIPLCLVLDNEHKSWRRFYYFSIGVPLWAVILRVAYFKGKDGKASWTLGNNLWGDLRWRNGTRTFEPFRKAEI